MKSTRVNFSQVQTLYSSAFLGPSRNVVSFVWMAGPYFVTAISGLGFGSDFSPLCSLSCVRTCGELSGSWNVLT